MRENLYLRGTSLRSGALATASLIHSFSVNFTKSLNSHTIRFDLEFRIENEYRNRFKFDVSPQLIYAQRHPDSLPMGSWPPCCWVFRQI